MNYGRTHDGNVDDAENDDGNSNNNADDKDSAENHTHGINA